MFLYATYKSMEVAEDAINDMLAESEIFRCEIAAVRWLPGRRRIGLYLKTSEDE